MSYSTKSIDIVKCNEKIVSSTSYRYTFNWYSHDLPFDEIKIDGIIIKTNKDELFEFEQEDVLHIEYINHMNNIVNSKIPGWLMNKLCINQYNCEKFSEIPNCTYIKIPIDMLIYNNKSQIKRIPINSSACVIKNITINVVSKLNVDKMCIIIKKYMWNIMPFIKNNTSLRLFNTSTYGAKYLGLFMRKIPNVMICNDRIPYDEKSIKNNSQLLLSKDDQKYKEALWQLYLILPNDVIRKIKSYLDNYIYWMPYEPNIEWIKAKNSHPKSCHFRANKPIVHMYGMKMF